MADNKISLRVVVNGAETIVSANVNAPLQTVAQHALNQTGNQGRPLADWQLKDASGNILDVGQKVGDLGLAGGALLYLTLGVGANG